ncbi:MAG: glycine betaine ABC transporter substrate-binding protein [Fibrobacterota bacterium]
MKKTVFVPVILMTLFLFCGIQEDRISAAFDAEFLTRPDGYKGLKKHYNFSFSKKPIQMDPGLMYKSVSSGAVDVIDGFATDGRIESYGLRVLRDDKNFFPPYYAAPLIRQETLEKYPEIEKVLSLLAGKLPDSTMQRLNFLVDEKNMKAGETAEKFLKESGLLDMKPVASGLEGSLTIGSKHFTEQEILGQMMAMLIEKHTGLDVDRKLNLGGTIICFNALKADDIDLYAEYTGTGLVNILKEEAMNDPDKTLKKVRNAFEKKYDLVWLMPFGFNNTYTLTMKEEKAEKLGIESISDLAEVIKSQKKSVDRSDK